MPLDLRDLNQDAIVSLFTLDFNPIAINRIVRFCNWTDTQGANVRFGGIEYPAYPIMASGFELNSTGQIPTPTLTVSNVFHDITKLTLQYDDLLGAKLIRTRTYAQYLDTGRTPNAAKTLPEDVYYVERKTKEDKQAVTFELSALLDLGDFELPSRPITANTCVWIYRSGECSYAGPAVADELDNPTNQMHRDQCGKKERSCVLRFGVNANLPMGAFPGVDAARGES